MTRLRRTIEVGKPLAPSVRNFVVTISLVDVIDEAAISKRGESAAKRLLTEQSSVIGRDLKE